jgi:hypothetical protein
MVLLASSYDQSRLFKAVDIQRERKFRIKSVTEELIGAEKEQKLVVWFTNDKRGLPLNKTNNRTLRGAFGDDVDGWVGKIIIIFSTMVELRGKPTAGLRVRIPPPKEGPLTATAAPKPVAPSGNEAVAAAANPPPTQQTTATTPTDPELDDEPPKSFADELDDEIQF